MRSRIVVAVVMFAAAMSVSAVAADDFPPVDESRTIVVGWGDTGQEACRNAYAIADAIAAETGQWYIVHGFRYGTDEFHEPPCWWELRLTFQKSDTPVSPY